MLNSIMVGNFIMSKRKKLGLTQQQLADRLNVSFQAISKWENGIAYPNIEMLRDLALVLGVSVDEILAGSEKDGEDFSYSRAGINIAYTDTIKKGMSKYLKSDDRRVLTSSIAGIIEKSEVIDGSAIKEGGYCFGNCFKRPAYKRVFLSPPADG